MPANINLIAQPKNKNCKLWRYMDIHKFKDFISTKELYLHRSDKFKDPYEGLFSSKNNKERKYFYGFTEEQSILFNKKMNEYNETFRKITFINCWHMNEYESAAMWDLYGKTNNTIAIETSYSKLTELLPKDTCLGIVTYADYENTFIPEGNYLTSFTYKRSPFIHEQEVRIIKHLRKTIYVGGMPEEYMDINEDRKGIKVPIDITKLINRIHISPNSESTFFDLVKEICITNELNIEINKSNLYEIK